MAKPKSTVLAPIHRSSDDRAVVLRCRADAPHDQVELSQIGFAQTSDPPPPDANAHAIAERVINGTM